MNQKECADSLIEKGSLVQCSLCRHFRYFSNSKGHNSPEALGECRSEPWDENRGQWAQLRHPCKGFVKGETSSDHRVTAQ